MSEMVKLPVDMILFGYRQWKTKDGRQIAYKDMNLPHLQNVVRMVARKGANHTFAAQAAYGHSGGDMAEMLASQSGDHHSAEAYKALCFTEQMKEYIQWREENCYIFHAPKAEYDRSVG
jgi:hypothetical protein